MDVSLVTSILAPVLGLLLTGTKSAAQQVGARVGDEVVSLAQQLWARLRPKVEASPAALEAAHDLGENPSDELARGAFEWQLTKIMQHAPELAAELEGILAAGAAGHGILLGERNVSVGRDVSGVIITGDGGSVSG